MHVYEYRCKKCGFLFKKLFLIVESAQYPCPGCGDTRERMLLNESGITLKRLLTAISPARPSRTR